jgi:hypothetical protein
MLIYLEIACTSTWLVINDGFALDSGDRCQVSGPWRWCGKSFSWPCFAKSNSSWTYSKSCQKVLHLYFRCTLLLWSLPSVAMSILARLDSKQVYGSTHPASQSYLRLCINLDPDPKTPVAGGWSRYSSAGRHQTDGDIRQGHISSGGRRERAHVRTSTATTS